MRRKVVQDTCEDEVICGSVGWATNSSGVVGLRKQERDDMV